MSKKSKKNYKQFSIIKLEDGMLALGQLISGVVINLRKYKEYSSEVDELIIKYKDALENNDVGIVIPAKEYDDINDKLLYRQREILKFVADCQKSSFSYKNLRGVLLKNNHLKSSLEDDETIIINEFLDVRNWSFHNPQSTLVANSEVTEKRIPVELKGLVKIEPQLNPLIITHTSNYDINMLLSLSIHVDRRIKQFEIILNRMKKDYEEMYDNLSNKPIFLFGSYASQRVNYHESFITSKLDDFSSDVVQISMAIQKSKYDGSDDAFNKWVINKLKNSEENKVEDNK